ncbi:MAG: radical SAM protein [Marinifilaceae bacterium]
MNTKKIISRYVYLFVSSKGKYLVYSSCFNSFLELSKELYNYIEKCKSDPTLLGELPEDAFKLLEENGIIVSDGADDIFVLKHQFYTQSRKHNKDKLGLVIVPTIDCNFDCPYCFERGKRSGIITDQVIGDLFNFIKRHKSAEEMDITWYGGEPLLAFEQIQNILNKLSSEVDIPLKKHTIITNGYLFNDEVIDFFKRYPLDNIQITLDGNEKRHNLLRADKSDVKGSSYNRIIHNIKNILKRLPETELHVRVNIDKTNIGDYYQVYSEIKAFTSSKNLIIYPGIIRLENSTNTNVKSPTIPREEVAELHYELGQKGMIDIPTYPSLVLGKTCCATKLNSYIIGPVGEIYRCWNDVSDKSRIVGYINQEKMTNPSLFYKYMEGGSWYNDPTCRKCFFLPICNGKCTWYNMRNLYHAGEYNLCQCMEKAPGMLNKNLEAYYESTLK